MFLSETVTAEEAACWGTGMLRWLMLRGFEWKSAQAVCKHGTVPVEILFSAAFEQ